MAEAGDQDFKKVVENQLEGILRREAGKDLPPLSSRVIKDVEGLLGGKEEVETPPPTPEEFKDLFVRLNKSLERLNIKKHPSSLKKRKRIKGVKVEGLGVVRVEEFTEADKQSEGLILRVKIDHNHEDKRDNVLQETVDLGSEGTAGYYEREHKKESGLPMLWGYLPEDAKFVFLNVRNLVLALESAPERRAK